MNQLVIMCNGTGYIEGFSLILASFLEWEQVTDHYGVGVYSFL
jgi:hypothetical protein